jgi:hypothetical protein
VQDKSKSHDERARSHRARAGLTRHQAYQPPMRGMPDEEQWSRAALRVTRKPLHGSVWYYSVLHPRPAPFKPMKTNLASPLWVCNVVQSLRYLHSMMPPREGIASEQGVSCGVGTARHLRAEAIIQKCGFNKVTIRN